MLSDLLASVLSDADALLIVPPFAEYDRPALGVHILQACAREEGFDVRILYANMLFAHDIGEADYNAICQAPAWNLLGERCFASAAYGVTAYPYGLHTLQSVDLTSAIDPSLTVSWDEDKFHHLASFAIDWSDVFADTLTGFSFKAIGCTSSFEQTAASVAILKRLKRKKPALITMMGGANCDGKMAKGLQVLETSVDYIFSGECEQVFPQFLHDLTADMRPDDTIINGIPCTDLDDIPTPDFSDYYTQCDCFLPDNSTIKSERMWLSYETSRGDFWGEKHQGTQRSQQQVPYREKSPDHVLTELHMLLEGHPTDMIWMSDTGMPPGYFQTLLLTLAEELPGLQIFYEQKSPLTLERALLLKKTGIQLIQAEIEALSTSLLMAMKKSGTATQHIALLRYARSVDIPVIWQMIYNFPGDRIDWYQETIGLLPLLTHLNPPADMIPLSLTRFSPYFSRASAYGIQNMRPIEAYFDFLPDHADVSTIASQFIGDYPSESRTHPTVMADFKRRVMEWRKRWITDKGIVPVLSVTPLKDGVYLLTDTRGLPGSVERSYINQQQAMIALVGMVKDNKDYVNWAMEKNVCTRIDGRLIPLATADPDILEEFEILSRRDNKQSIEDFDSSDLDMGHRDFIVG